MQNLTLAPVVPPRRLTYAHDGVASLQGRRYTPVHHSDSACGNAITCSWQAGPPWDRQWACSGFKFQWLSAVPSRGRRRVGVGDPIAHPGAPTRWQPGSPAR